MNNFIFRIADAMNTYNPALAIIKSKGYKLFLLPDEREDFYGNYWAIKENRDFIIKLVQLYKIEQIELVFQA